MISYEAIVVACFHIVSLRLFHSIFKVCSMNWLVLLLTPLAVGHHTQRLFHAGDTEAITLLYWWFVFCFIVSLGIILMSKFAQ